MGDRTTVYLTLPKLLIKIAVPLFSIPPSESNLGMNLDYVTYTFEEIKAGLSKAGFNNITLFNKSDRMDAIVEGYKP